MIIFLYGSDTFGAKEKLESLKTGFLKKNNGNQVSIFTIEADEINLADFRNKVLSSGLFAEKKMVVWKRKEKSAKRKTEDKEQEKSLLEVIKKIPSETSLVVWSQGEDTKFLKTPLGKYLLKQKYVFQFNMLFGNALTNWIQERALLYGCKVDASGARAICDILGSDLWKIDLELNKICNYTIGGRDSNSVISRKIVDDLLKKEAEENIFKFIDALAGKNKKAALLTLQNEFRAGANELSVLGMIARQIRILLQIKSMQGAPTQDMVAKELGVHPYVAQKSLSQIKNFHINELKNIYRGLLQIDMSIKTSSSPARVLFDRMISKL